MSILEKKIDFVVLVSVTMANSNGDPLNGNRPRIDYEGYGEISDVCIKRKIRNRMQDLGHEIFVKSDERSDDGFSSLKKRAESVLKGIKLAEEYKSKACNIWLDVRSFGQVFAFGKNNGSDSVSCGVRGPVSIHQSRSVSPVNIRSIQITKSVNGEDKKKNDIENLSDGSMSSDRMGMKHFVQFGLYEIKGSINVQLAAKTGFSYEDSQILKECLRTLFVNDASSARPDGSMEVYKLYWWEHNSAMGQYSSACVHRSLRISLKDDVDIPSSVDDYVVKVEPLEDLQPEIIDGL